MVISAAGLEVCVNEVSFNPSIRQSSARRIRVVNMFLGRVIARRKYSAFVGEARPGNVRQKANSLSAT